VSEALLELEDVSVGYGAVQALRQVSLHVNPGEVVALIGSNGAGKTTTLRTISRLVKPTGGEIRFEGESLLGMAAERLAGRGIGHVPEGRRVFGDLRVIENLLLGGFSRGRAAAQELDSVFALFPMLRERRNQLARTLSGGQQQQLAIGRALMSRPRLLMLDEPSLGLAPLVAQTVFQLIERIRSESRTAIILVEQNARAALKIADRGYVLETGRVVLEGTAAELRNSDLVAEAYLGRRRVEARPGGR
jgi:branched-chain amino acid transport system ATP-binding protein